VLRLPYSRLIAQAAALCTGCLAVAVAAASGVADPAIDRWIAAHANKLRGAEVAGTRYAVTGDLDGDGRRDFAVLYTLQGTGADRFLLRFLAVFRRGPQALEYRAHALVGGRGMREVNRATILGRQVEIESLEFRRGDAACCPTRFVKMRYRLDGRRLERVAGAPQAKK
jgi:hypothetical protein